MTSSNCCRRKKQEAIHCRPGMVSAIGISVILHFDRLTYRGTYHTRCLNSQPAGSTAGQASSFHAAKDKNNRLLTSREW